MYPVVFVPGYPTAHPPAFPAPLPADFDYLDFDPHAYMESSGYNAMVDRAFAPLFGQIEMKTREVRAYLDKLFLDWELETCKGMVWRI